MARIYYLRRDTLGDCTEAEELAFARYLARAIGHDVEFSERSGCKCDDYHEHRAEAQQAWESGEWWPR